MKRKSTRILPLLLALLLIAGLTLALLSSALASTETRTEMLDLTDNDWQSEAGVTEGPTGTWSNSAQGWSVTVNNSATPPTYTLTLNGANFSGSATNMVNLPENGEVIIDCIASSTIATTASDGIAIYGYADGNVTVTFTGDDKLTLSAPRYALLLQASGGSSVIQLDLDDANVDASSSNRNAIKVEGPVDVQGSVLRAVTESEDEAGLFAYSSLVIDLTSNVFCSGGSNAVWVEKVYETLLLTVDDKAICKGSDSPNATALVPVFIKMESSSAYFKIGTTEDEGNQARTLSITPPPQLDARNGVTIIPSGNTAPTDLTFSDYTFEGWYTGIDGTGEKRTDVPALGTTYYAHWTKNGNTVLTQTLALAGLSAILPGSLSTPPAGCGITWDESNAILSLNNAIIDCSGTENIAGLGLLAGTIQLNGNNIVRGGTQSATSGSSSCGIVCGQVEITSDNNGSLTAIGAPLAQDLTGTSAGIQASSACILSGKAQVTAKGGTVTTDRQDAVSAGIISMGGYFTLSDTAQLNAIGQAAASQTGSAISMGVYGMLHVGGKAQATVSGGSASVNTDEFFDALSGGAFLSQVSGGSLTASGGTSTLKDNAAGASAGVCSQLTMDGGNTTLSGQWRAIATMEEANGGTAADVLSVTGEPKFFANTTTQPAENAYVAEDIATYKYLNISYIPTLSFDNRGGGETAALEIDTEHPIAALPDEPSWGSYTFEGWYSQPDGQGDVLTLAAAQAITTGATYYAYWTLGGKPVLTQPLDFTAVPAPTLPTDCGASWDPATLTLTLSGCLLDCSGLTNSGWAMKLPDNATINLPANTENHIKAGFGPFLDDSTGSIGIIVLKTNNSIGSLFFTGTGCLEVESASFSTATNTQSYASSTAIEAHAQLGAEAPSTDAPVLLVRGGNVTNLSTEADTYASSSGISEATVYNGSLTAFGGEATGNTAQSFGIESLNQFGGWVRATGSNRTTTAATPGDYDVSVGVESVINLTGGNLWATGRDSAISFPPVPTDATVKGSPDYNAQSGLTAARIVSNDGERIQMGEAGDGALALTASLSFPPAVQGAATTAEDAVATYGAAAAGKSYIVSFPYFIEATDKTVSWCDANGVITDAPQAGSGLAINDTLVTFTTSPTADAGSYYIKVTAKESGVGDPVESAPILFTVSRAEATAAMTTAATNVYKGGKAGASFNLPILPKNASYGQPVLVDGGQIALSALAVNGQVLTYTAAESTVGHSAQLTLAVAESTNYNAYTCTVTITSVDKQAVTISCVSVAQLTDGSRIYDGKEAMAVVDNSPANAPKAVLSQGGTVVDIPADGFDYVWSQGTTTLSGPPKTVGEYKLTVSVKESNQLYMGSLEIPFSITAKPLTLSGVAATNRPYNATTNVTLSSGTLTGKVGLDDVSAALSTGTVASAAVGDNKPVTVTKPTLTGADSGNYVLNDLAAIYVNITPAQLTVTGSGDVAVTKVYDGTTAAGTLTGAPAFSGKVGQEDVTVTATPGGYGDGDVSASKTISLALGLSGADKGNYALTSASYSFNAAAITKADYTGAAVSGAMNVLWKKAASYEFDLTDLTYPAGFKNITYSAPALGDNTDGLLTAAPTLNGSKLSFSVAALDQAGQTGEMQVTATSTNYNNYTVTVTVATIAQAPVTLSGLILGDKTYDGQPIAYTGALKAVRQDNQATVTIPAADYLYAWSTADDQALSAAPVKAGHYKLTVSIKESNEEYSGSWVRDFTINKKTVTVKAVDKSITAQEKLPEFTVAYSGFVGTDSADKALDTLAVVTCAADGQKAGSFAITFLTQAVLNDTVGANYTLDHVNGILTVKEAPEEEELFTATLRGGIAKALSFTLAKDIATLKSEDDTWDKVLAAAISNGKIQLDLSDCRQTVNALRLPAALVKKIAAAAWDSKSDVESLQVTLPVGSITFDRDALQTLANNTGSNGLLLRIEAATGLTASQQQAVGSAPTYLVTITGKNGLLHKLNGWAEITLPYLKAVADSSAIRGYWLDNSAKLHALDAKYLAKDKSVTFSVNHLSLFALTYAAELAAWRCPYTDTFAQDWFYGYVRDLSITGVVNGYPDASFRPLGNVTYGEALKLILMATGYGQQARTNTHWASGYLSFAQANGLMGSVVNLNAAIDRQTVAQIAAKAMKLAKAENPSSFADTADSGVLSLYEAGIVEGNFDSQGNRLFYPTSSITRAEITTIIWRIDQYEK